MPNNRKPFKPKSYYHIYNRGYLKNKLFYEDKDYTKFIRNIDIYSNTYKTNLEIKKFCILPNHFHLLVLNKNKGLIISDFMRRLQISYAMYFKNKYSKFDSIALKQPVFEGRYKAKHISNLKYLNQTIQYIENNPVKHDYVKSPDDRNRKS